MGTSAQKLTITTLGPLSVIAADGTDRTPSGKKAKGLIALLALSTDGRRARPWLQDKLWSTREPAQGAYSLRQALTEIRKAFGDARACLITVGNNVALDSRFVEIKHWANLAASDLAVLNDMELYEGLDIADDEFEAWLRDHRALVRSKLKSQKQNFAAQPLPVVTLPVGPPSIRLMNARHHGRLGTRAQLFADALTDMVAQTTSELSSINVVDLRQSGSDAPDLSDLRSFVTITADAIDDISDPVCRLTLVSAVDKRLLGSTLVHLNGSAPGEFDPRTLRDLNRIVEQIYGYFDGGARVSDQRSAATLCRQAIQKIFRLTLNDLRTADCLLEQAFQLEPRGIFLAWRGYLRSVMIVEFRPKDKDVLAEEALAFSRRSLELEPTNSFVAAFGAQVQVIVRQSYAAAFDLAERSIRLNPANPLGWGCLGIAECNLGKSSVGYEHALRARELAGATPLNFFTNGQAMIAASLAGDIDQATILGEVGHELTPSYKPPIRFLIALYLLRDRQDEAMVMAEKLKETEPDFSFDLLRDRSYPVSSLHRSKLLEKLPRRQI